ncbi:MAG: hypothetical protein JWP12_3918 [Bacteroidetes bacterium]|nr:hypothetical protein [Bacteroidota bacterium]
MIKTKKLTFLFCFFFTLITTVKAQNGTDASGGDASGSGGSASYSIGQIDYITEQETGGTITQGLQQPFEISVITGIENTAINLSATVYPNPTVDMVTLSIEGTSTENMTFILCDLQGKVIRNEKLSADQTIISMAELTKATYLIKVLDNSKEVKTFKIIKN